MLILDLPDCIIEQILEHLCYDEIARQRIICQKFNRICQGLLNMGFNKMIRRHGNLIKAIKSQLPRRESERRNHPLAKHSDILTCIETRMSMLSMTYTKYIEANSCCFIPGKVIDEVFRVLKLISSIDPTNSACMTKLQERPLRTHEVLQELRDISTMAIDHFEEKIAPALKKKTFCDLPSRSLLSLSSAQLQCSPDPATNATYLLSPAFFTYLQQGGNLSSTPQRVLQVSDPNQSNYIRLERKFKQTMRKLNNVIRIQNKQSQKLRNCAMQINELNAQVIDLRRRFEESNNSKRSLEQIATVVSDASANSSGRNIKPRTATIILKRITEASMEAPMPKKKAKFD